MHRCLNIDEIVRFIAYELVAPGRKATAVCLACCCKSFEDPVLDTLWATQDKLTPLFECFPGDIWNKGGWKCFKRFPTATEWARFRKYAQKMRVLRDNDNSDTLSWEGYSVIQLYTFNGPLLPNLTTLDLWGIGETLILFIPLFLSPTITSISFGAFARSLPKSTIASVITNSLTPCPNLRDINLWDLPRDPMITAAVSGMFIAANQNVLQKFHVKSPLTEEVREAVYKSRTLSGLSVVIEDGTSVPSVSLPNLTCLEIECCDGRDGLQLLRRAAFGKLESVRFDLESSPTSDFLEAFTEANLSSSIQNTLSEIYLSTKWSWDPNYSSLLPFIWLVRLHIRHPCYYSCATVEDDIVIDLSRAMPKLKSLSLGRRPCDRFTGGVTAKGLLALARNCPNLSSLCLHFQVASFSHPPTDLEMTRKSECSASWTDCALTELEVGKIPVPEASASMVAITLLRIFPRITIIDFDDEGWIEVQDKIHRSK